MLKCLGYCEAVVEAIWLTTVMCVPLYLNIWGESIQSQKNYLLRSLAVILAAAWITKFFCQGGLRSESAGFKRSGLKSLLATPLAIPVTLLSLVWFITTLLSLSPWLSFWGVWFRRDGSYTTLSCLLFFAAVATGIRSDQQVNRLITAAILASLPISLYGIGQRFSLEPIITDASQMRVSSTFANPVFLGAYLIMVFPLTLSRVLSRWRAYRIEGKRGSSDVGQAVSYSLIASAQFLAILFTASRGPFVGLVTGGSVMLLSLAAHWRQRRLAWATIGAGCLVLTAAILFALPHGPFSKLAKGPGMGRFSEMLDPKAGSGGERSALWQAAAQGARFSDNMEMADGRKDPLSHWRFLCGYGPETAGSIILRHGFRDYNLAMLGHETHDRFHNEIWDALISMGLPGLAAYLCFTFLIIFQACKWVGLIPDSRAKAIFWLLFLAGGLAGSLGLVFWQGLTFLGVGLRFGTTLGLLAFLVWQSFRRESLPTAAGIEFSRALTIVALLSGVAAHLMEVSFSFDVESTLLYFWTFAALLIVIGHRLPAMERSQIQGVTQAATAPAAIKEKASPTRSVGSGKVGTTKTASRRPTTKAPTPGWRVGRGEIVGGMLIGLILINIGAMLLQGGNANTTLQTIGDALTRLPGQNNALTWSVLLALMITWVLSAFTLTNESPGATSAKNPFGRSLAMTLAVSSGIALIYWLVVANRVTSMLAPARVTMENVGRFLGERLFLVDFFYGFILVVILILAAVLVRDQPPDTLRPNRFFRLAPWAGPALGLAAIAGVQTTNLQWCKGGIMMNRAKAFVGQRQWPIAAAICEAAIQAVPAADDYYLALCSILEEQAAIATDADQQRTLFQRAEKVLEAGRKFRALAPIFPIAQGNLFMKWAQTERSVERRRSLGRKAIEFYGQALKRDPGNFHLWNAIAYLELALFQSPEQAETRLNHSLELYPNSAKTYGFLGDLYFQKGAAAKDTADRGKFFSQAVTNYQQAMKLTEASTPEMTFLYAVALGKAHSEMQDWSGAIAAYEKALLVAPTQERWLNEETLGRLYSQIKDHTNSVEHFRRALELAPADRRPGLMQLRQQVLANP